MHMDNLGFIHNELDIKLLILFILKRLLGPVDSSVLFDLCSSDSGIHYFEYSDCLAKLADSGHVSLTEDSLYSITAKGITNVEALENSLPYSVRNKVLDLILPVNEELQRAALIGASVEKTADGCYVQLSMSDGKGDVLKLRMLCESEETAARISKNFRKNAEGYCSQIMTLLSE